MRLTHLAVCVMCGAIALAAMSSSALAAVPIGSSSLIQVLDYSDSFTTTDNGGLPDRDGVGGWPLGQVDYPVTDPASPGEGLAVENCYGNPQRSWGDWNFSVRTDDTAVYRTWYPEMPFYGSGAGSDTGMTESGGYYDDMGFTYNLANRSRFVIQFDAIQSGTDRTSLGFGTTNPLADPWDEYSIGNANTFMVFVRTTGHSVYTGGDVAIFHSSTGELDSGLDSPIYYGEEWHNYALLVDTTARTIEVFIDELSIGVIDVDTVAGGVLNGLPMVNEAVIWSYCDGDYLHYADNYQVGSPELVNPDPIPGDANNSGYVDEVDAQALAANWGVGNETTPATWEMGNFNGDFVVNAADAAIMAANWTGAPPLEGSPVPEPSFVLLAVGALGLALLRRTR